LFYNPIVPEGMHPKFHNFWQGPYSIVGKLSRVVYKIQRDSDSVKSEGPMLLDSREGL
jgi:hypothetical protein